MQTWQLNRKNLNFNSHTREGVTGIMCYPLWKIMNFNSHTREGVTLIGIMLLLKTAFQLTHPWGCDTLRFIKLYLIHNISTHTPVRVWLCRVGNFLISWIFQLTHPWGCDIKDFDAKKFTANFNSHTREGVTFWCSNIYFWDRFQLTHPWGCD